jgi:hypothetical protein
MPTPHPPSNYNAGWLYKESQRFTQWWMWALMILGTAAFVYALAQSGAFSGQDEPGAETAATLALVGLLLAIALFVGMRLDIQINESAVYYRFFPFQRRFKFCEWSEVESVDIREYKPLTEYGGWGIRFKLRGKGWAYSVSGNKGLQLELKNGKRLLLGTQRPDDMERVINVLRNKNLLPKATA